MSKKLIREWKKVFLSDLSYIVYELKEQTKSPCMILIEGPLGAGKTTFVSQFIGEDVTSPTYSLIQDYKTILHADFYRLKNPEEVYALELAPQLEDKNYFLVEWGERYATRLSKEIPENFSIYLLEVQINNGQSPEKASRNFILSSWSEE